jgi:hypothetical protein
MSQLVFLVAYCVLVGYGIYRSVVQGRIPKVRQPAAIKALEEAVGRCVEMGRPLLFQTGIGDVNIEGVTHMAMLSVLNYTANMVAQKNAKFICSSPSPTLFPLAEAIVREAYVAAGRPEGFTSDTVRYLSNNQMAYCSAVMDLMSREKVAANVQIGFFQAENLITLEAAKDVGAINIGGAYRMLRIPDMAIGCDYFLIGEEVFAAGAFCSQDPVQVGSLLGQDMSKWVALALIVVGALFTMFGSDAIVKILRL